MEFVRLNYTDLNNYQPLMIIAPTGSGKTFAMIKYALSENNYNKIIFALPTKAAIREVFTKIKNFTDNVGRDDSDARLDDNFNPTEIWNNKKIIVTSYERLLSSIITSQDLFQNSLIIIDEAHLLLYHGRNCIIQEILAYYKFLRNERKFKINIVLLSATMPEVENLSLYLEAKVIQMEKRPIEIEIKRVKVEEFIGKQEKSRKGEFLDPIYSNYYLRKAIAFINYVKKGEINLSDYKQFLVYTNTRRSAEEIAELIQKELKVNTTYHHAGLPIERRKQIEDDMRKGKIKNKEEEERKESQTNLQPFYKIIVATDTLSLSINTNVDAVVILALKRFNPAKTYVEPSTIAQIIGRAGRPGYSRRGLAIIFEEKDEHKIVDKALNKEYGTIKEPLDYAQTVLRWIYTKKNIDLLSKYGYNYSPGKIKEAITYLENIKAINKTTNGKYEVTPLGEIFSYELVPKIGMNLLKIIIKFDQTVENENPLSRSILYAFSYSFTVDEEGKNRYSLQKDSVFLKYLGELKGKLNKYAYQRIGIKVEPPDCFYSILEYPNLIPTDNLAESLRKSAEIIFQLSRRGIIDKKLQKSSLFLMNLMREYRKLLIRERDIIKRESQTEIEKFLESSFSKEKFLEIM
ncbi:DEAD/DEAH box helicase [Acidianus sulfidivorans]|nr:DEAD/DEAH box helicase [Acidianus sulfidivorans]